MTTMKRNSHWYTIATIVGTTVGVGMFGIPIVFAKAGFGIGVLFLAILTAIVILLNLMYGEVVLRTQARHQLIGYAEKYLGPVSKRFLLFTLVFSVYGALLAYVIISGTFLSNFFSFYFYVSPTTLSYIFFILASLMILAGLRAVAWFDLGMLVFFCVVVASIMIFGVRHINLHNYILWGKEYWFLPFGVIFFALSGASAIPLAREIITGNEMRFKKSIILGTLIPAVLYLILTFFVVGVSGETTSPDAISGLSSSLGEKIVFLGSIFGFLAVSTSFLGMGVSLKESFQYDFKLKKSTAWLLVILPPLLLFYLGMNNFIDVIGVVGGVALSLEGIFLLFLYLKAKKLGDREPEYSLSVPRAAIYLLVVVFAFAIVYTLIN